MTKSYATYCVVDSDQPVPEGLVGLHAGAVTYLPYRGIGAAVSTLAGPVGDIVAGAVQHEAVVERLMEAHTVLPMRFPTVFSSADAILAMLAQHYDRFNESLCRLRGRVEFGVRVLWPNGSPLERDHPCDSECRTTSGRQYMLERYRRHKCRQALQEQAAQCGGTLDASLGEWATAKKVRNLITDRLVFDGVYLIDMAREGDFRRAFVNLRSEASGLKYLLSGPWPPYSFIETIDG